MTRFAVALALLCASLIAAAQYSGPRLQCWQVYSQATWFNGADNGGEFAFGSGAQIPIPSWVPNPLVISEVHITYYEPPGIPGAGLNGSSYGALSANTDPGLAWYRAGCTVNNQVCQNNGAIGVDLGKLFVRAGNPEPFKIFKFDPPAVVGNGDGLVISQVGFNGGTIQPVWNICWKQ